MFVQIQPSSRQIQAREADGLQCGQSDGSRLYAAVAGEDTGGLCAEYVQEDRY